MMKRYFIQIMFFGAFAIAMVSCSRAGGNKAGHEFMPDMVHSTGYEANLYDYYYYNRWGTEEEYKKFASPRLPVNGTIARGYAGGSSAEKSGVINANGSVPYYFMDSEDDRIRASKEIIDNPYPISSKGLAVGKKLYEINCGICHGEKADGAGYLAREDGGKYPVLPANFLLDTFYRSTNGRFYHAIMFGKNMMASYADKLSYEERWQVIHYIRSLQAKSKKLQYDEMGNTFTKDIPAATWVEPKPVNVEKTLMLPSTAAEEQHTPITKEKNPKH